MPWTALGSPGYDGQPAVYLYIAALEVTVLNRRAAVEVVRSWLRLQEYHFAIADGVELHDEQVEVAEVKVK